MKKILFILLLLPFISKAQVYQIMPQYGYEMQRARMDSALLIPQDTIRNKTGIARKGTSGYIGNGTYWTQLAGGGGSTDTTSLSNRINLKLNISDTANIRLRPIAGTNTTITGSYPNLTFNSTSADSTIFYTKFRSDTSRANIYTSLANKVETGSDGSLKSLTITGTNGAGHIHLRHQASLPTATANSSVIYSNSDGNFAWKNDGNYHTTLATNSNTANRVYTFQNKSYTVADSADVAAKLNISDTSNIRLRPVAGTNLTLSGTYPDITFNATNQTANKQDTGTAWLKSGNNNINAGNYIGSSNNSSLRFRTNNTLTATLDSFNLYGTKFQLGAATYPAWLASSQGTYAELGLGQMTIRSDGSINPYNATLSLNGSSSSTDNVVVSRCSSCGAGDIFAAKVESGTNLFIINRTGQVAMGASSAAASAALDITSTTRGLLIPRMTTTQMNAISSPATGLMIYNTTDNVNYTYNGSAWVSGLTAGTQTIAGAKTFSSLITFSNNTNGFNYSFTQYLQNSAVSLTSFNFIIALSGSTAPTSGIKRLYLDSAIFNPSSGNASFANFESKNTINQTGGASGITRGFYINDIITAAADYRALEIATGKIVYSATNTATGTTGAQTINKISGKVNAAAGSTSLVVTNNLVTAASIVMCELGTNDATARITNVVEGAGSFTINYVAPTGETVIKFWVIN